MRNADDKIIDLRKKMENIYHNMPFIYSDGSGYDVHTSCKTIEKTSNLDVQNISYFSIGDGISIIGSGESCRIKINTGPVIQGEKGVSEEKQFSYVVCYFWKNYSRGLYNLMCTSSSQIKIIFNEESIPEHYGADVCLIYRTSQKKGWLPFVVKKPCEIIDNNIEPIVLDIEAPSFQKTEGIVVTIIENIMNTTFSTVAHYNSQTMSSLYHDDSKALQSSIDCAARENRKLIIGGRNDIFCISTELNVPSGSNIVIGGTIKWISALPCLNGIFKIIDAHDISIVGEQCTANHISFTNSIGCDCGIVSATRCNDVIIKNIKMRAPHVIFSKIIDCSDIIISSCRIKGDTKSAIGCNFEIYNSSNILIERNHLENGEIYIDSSNAVNVRENIIKNNKEGIQLCKSQECTLCDNTLVNLDKSIVASDCEWCGIHDNKISLYDNQMALLLLNFTTNLNNKISSNDTRIKLNDDIKSHEQIICYLQQGNNNSFVNNMFINEIGIIEEEREDKIIYFDTDCGKYYAKNNFLIGVNCAYKK